MAQGIIISQSGIPIDDANDYQKVLDSRWKFLDIHVEKEIDMTTQVFTIQGYYAIKLLDHNLGYHPGFEFYPDPAGVDGLGGDILADDHSIYMRIFWYSSLPSYANIKALIRVYAIDILAEYQAPTTPPSTAGAPTKSTIGAVFSNQATGVKTIDSTNPDDFTLYTPVKAVAVHKTGTAQANNSVTIRHDVGYPPTYLTAAIQYASEWDSFYANPIPNVNTVGALTSGALGLVVASASTLVGYGGPQSSLATLRFAYIILKDPAELAR